eukprot:COSAG06_NODE_3832_length_4854_cov_8.124501_6_plen_68_part_00
MLDLADKWDGRIVHDKPKLTSKQALSQGVQAANHATDSLAALITHVPWVQVGLDQILRRRETFTAEA